jgi:3-hydroxybutyryl-CoA dehydratase
MLTASVISAAVANRLPGPGAVYMSQSLIFRAPVRPGDTVHATVTVKEIIPARNRVLLQTTCTVAGLGVIDGEALVQVGSRRPPPIAPIIEKIMVGTDGHTTPIPLKATQ